MRKEIRFAGFGGQGVIKAALLTTIAAGLNEGIEVAQTQSYGPEARGGACKSDVVISDQAIDYVKALNIDYFLVMSQPAMNRYAPELDLTKVVVIADGTLVKSLPAAATRVYLIDATARAEQDFGKALYANIIMIGALAAVSGLITVADLDHILDGNVPPKTLGVNRKALRLGYELGQAALGGQRVNCRKPAGRGKGHVRLRPPARPLSKPSLFPTERYGSSFMYLREHQAKDILRRAGVAVPVSEVVSTPEAAAGAAKSIGPCVVKAQVRAGGRGKAGFIAMARDPAQAFAAAGDMLGRPCQGEIVNSLLVEARLDIARELYLGVVLDTDRAKPVVLMSTHGGVDIEQATAEHPEAFCRVELDPLQEDVSDPAPWRRRWQKAGLDLPLLDKAAALTRRLTELFYQTEAFTLEINPLVVTRQGALVAGDCKLVVDDAALFRQPVLQGFVEIDECSPEARAQKAGVTYVALDPKGSIGVMAGGAGICMTTMDEVVDAGGKPLAFIDLGGGISEENMAAALEIMSFTPGINGLIVNVFGGINNCETMARGVRRAGPDLLARVTLVVKMRGHSQEEGWAILKEMGVTLVRHGTTSEAVARLMEKLRAEQG